MNRWGCAVAIVALVLLVGCADSETDGDNQTQNNQSQNNQSQ